MRSRDRHAYGVLLSLALALALAAPASAAGRGPYVEGEELTFAFLDLDGRTVRSSDPEFRGKVLLIDLWGTWCPPCVTEIPTFIDLQQRFGERGLVIVAIAFESEEEPEASRRERLREYVEHHGINYMVLDGYSPQDTAESLPELKDVRGFPVEILIDRNGNVVDARNSYGYKKRWARRLERELVDLLEADAEPESSRPWLRQVAPPDRLAGLHTLFAEADVEVSDGTGFSTTVVYHDPRHAVFRSVHGDRTTTMGVDGEELWAFDGTEQKTADPFVREFVLGHQFHAQILFYDRLHPDHEAPRQTTFDGRPCSVVSTGDEDSLRALYYDPDGRPLGMRAHHGPEMRITIKFGDWREVGRFTLPFLVRIDDGSAQFEYHYTDVRLNEGSVDDLRPAGD